MELTQLREQMDAIDSRLVALFQERMALSAAIGAYKKAHGLPVFQPEREREKLDAMEQGVPDELRQELRSLYTLLFALSRARQEQA